MKPDRKGSWYLLTGAVLGVAMGLIYSWVISPVKYVDAPPYALRADYKEEYRALVAAAYMYSGDLVRARDRLKQLKDDNPAQNVAMQAQRALAAGHPEAEVRALSLLATALSQGVTPTSSDPSSTLESTSSPDAAGSFPNPVGMGVQIKPPVSATPPDTQLTQAFSNTPEPSTPAISTPTIGAPFVLQDNTLVCNINQPDPLIQVEIEDAAGQPIPGMELVVTWADGEDHFFTGLQPELGVGYGDFLMTPNIVYFVSLAKGGQQVNDLTATQCVADDGTHYWGSWMLTFVQP